jgi:hypothetical protein
MFGKLLCLLGRHRWAWKLSSAPHHAKCERCGTKYNDIRKTKSLEKCGCVCYCPGCSDILNDQADCTDTDLVRYTCNTCGTKSEWTFDAAPWPMLLKKIS